jgi:excinuclease ABC subunit B
MRDLAIPVVTGPVGFELDSRFQPAGDQPEAIAKLVKGIQTGTKHQVLMGVTGSGKTFTMANVIQAMQRPTLVLSHNKTLAAQLYSEFREFFPRNAVHYFVSYYDYYQPEAYIPQRDIYIEKDASINEEIDRLRLAATSALVSRRDVVIVASVSCIYGLGSPSDYKKMLVPFRVGATIDRDEWLLKLIDIQYERNDVAFERSRFRVRGDSMEIWPSYEEFAYRIEMWGDEIERISIINPVSGQSLSNLQEIYIYPAKHFVTPEERLHSAIQEIRKELDDQLVKFKSEGKLLEAQRLNARVRFDLEMMQEVGHCPGIENYSRPLSGKKPGEPPDTLYEFFPDDFLLLIDESHVTIPQVRAMYAGDRSRKTTLVEHGFRLPCALDNRPLKFEEWEGKIRQAIFVSATPAEYELKAAGGEVVEQVIRPTGLLDPIIEVQPARGQVMHLLEEIRIRVKMGHRTLVTALTKRLAEDLATFFTENDVRCRWLHSELDAFERVALLQDLREGRCDVIVGVNLLREGLDLPEVSLVAILDADKEGFLRSETSLIQTIGRAARNVDSKVLLYADRVTDSMQNAMNETERRRKIQKAYNDANGITPQTVHSNIRQSIQSAANLRQKAREMVRRESGSELITEDYLKSLEEEMLAAAQNLEFERAARLRDKIVDGRNRIGEPIDDEEDSTKSRRNIGRQRKRSSTNNSKRVPRPRKN